VTLEAEPVSPGEALSGKLSGKSHGNDVSYAQKSYIPVLLRYVVFTGSTNEIIYLGGISEGSFMLLRCPFS